LHTAFGARYSKVAWSDGGAAKRLTRRFDVSRRTAD